MRMRYMVALWLRLAALALCTFGSALLAYVAVCSAISPSRQMWIHWAYEPLSYAAMFLVPGIVMFRLASVLTRWLVPMPRLICPQCSHSLFRLAEPRCPECGCPVPESYVTRGERPRP